MNVVLLLDEPFFTRKSLRLPPLGLMPSFFIVVPSGVFSRLEAPLPAVFFGGAE